MPAIHAVIGCDTTSAMFRIGKAKILKKLRKNSESIGLLERVGMGQQISEDVLTNVAEFVQTVHYKGKSEEILVQTRVRTLETK